MIVRFPFADDYSAIEDAWEAPDALGVSGAERLVWHPRLAALAVALLGWLCVVALGVMVVGSMNIAFGQSSGTLVPLIPACVEHFKELPGIASRLGVKPTGNNSGTYASAGSIVLTMCNGDQYDFFEIINAALDRLDRLSH
jgi:hypothetical protein